MLKLRAIHRDPRQQNLWQEDVAELLWLSDALYQGLCKVFCVFAGILGVHQSFLARKWVDVFVCSLNSHHDVLQWYPKHSCEWLTILCKLCKIRSAQCTPRGFGDLVPANLGHSWYLNQRCKRSSHQNGQGQCKELEAALCHGTGSHKGFWSIRITKSYTFFTSPMMVVLLELQVSMVH